MMRTRVIVAFFSALLILPTLAMAGAVSEKDFQVQTTENLINLCTATPDDPLYQQAINFCHGYLVGAYAYYQAESAGPKGVKLVCLPEPPPSRNEAIKMFIEWTKAHPQYMKERPVETEFRFLMEKWGCTP